VTRWHHRAEPRPGGAGRGGGGGDGADGSMHGRNYYGEYLRRRVKAHHQREIHRAARVQYQTAPARQSEGSVRAGPIYVSSWQRLRGWLLTCSTKQHNGAHRTLHNETRSFLPSRLVSPRCATCAALTIGAKKHNTRETDPCAAPRRAKQ
jgi:hypothetical protein